VHLVAATPSWRIGLDGMGWNCREERVQERERFGAIHQERRGLAMESNRTRRLVVVTLFAIQVTFRAGADSNGESSKNGTSGTTWTTPSMSVVLLTIYDNSFARIVRHYAAMPFVTDILVVWNNLDKGPPFVNGSFRVPVTVVLETKNTLNNRYKHANMLQNDLAFLTDDDILLDFRTLQYASRFLATDPLAVVGFFPRQVAYEENGWKYGARGNLKEVFHMTTGRAHLLRARWMNAFTSLPSNLLDFIDKNKPTCEDITLHFLIANTTSSTLIFVKPCSPVVLRRRGMSKRTRHWWVRRSACLNRLSTAFGGMLLRNNTKKYFCADYLEEEHRTKQNRTLESPVLAPGN